MLNSVIGFSLATVITATAALACGTEKLAEATGVPLEISKDKPKMRDGFTLCNKRPEHFSVAIGYKRDGGEWQSEGWWTANPGQCVWLLADTQKVETVYIHAARKATGSVLTGSMFACVKDRIFTAFGADDCSARGLSRVGFADR
jgi:uncharacterized membrane protein